MTNMFSHQCIAVLQKANGILGRLRPKVICVRTVKTYKQTRKNTFDGRNRPDLSSALCSPSFFACSCPCSCNVTIQLAVSSCPGCSHSVTSQWMNHHISAFPAVTQNNFNLTLPFNYLRLISIPSTWWYSFSVFKCIFTSSLFIVLATLYLHVFTVLLEILLCKISAIIITGECFSSMSGRLQCIPKN